MDEYYIWKVERVSDEFYWDNYVMAIFWDKDLASDFAKMMQKRGFYVKVSRTKELWEALPKTINV